MGLAWGAPPRVEHLVIIGCDGLSVEGVQKGNTPVLHNLMARGAYTFHARAVMPTVSSPNWASMIMGAGPEQHGITSNKWERNQFQIAPTAVGPEGIFPTIFGVLRAQRSSAVIGVFHDWQGFGRLVEGTSVDALEHVPGAEATMKRAIQFWKERKPTLLFIHLDHVDHAGHQKGWGTPEYLAAVETADKLIGSLLEAIEADREAKLTAVLVTADHGGNGKSHGNETMAEIEIPWILMGPGVAAGKEIAAAVNTYDTAATVAYLLKLRPPDSWIAKPVMDAFSGKRARVSR